MMNAFSRSRGLRRAGDHWQSDSAQLAGFVPMQGIGQAPLRRLKLADPAGGHVALRFGDETRPENPALLDRALEAEPVTVWSGLTIARGTGFEDLQLRLAGGFLLGFIRIDASDSQALPTAEANRNWFGFGGVLSDSFSVAMRKTGIPGAEFEFGARAFGPHAVAADEALTAQIAAWGRLRPRHPGRRVCLLAHRHRHTAARRPDRRVPQAAPHSHRDLATADLTPPATAKPLAAVSDKQLK
jgi:protein-L-isoaspartate(D-aspartate) O-methyltransferase